MKNVVIDSCVFVSHFGKDKLTPQSKLFFRKISQTDTQIILPALVEAEVLVVLKQNGATNLGKIVQIFSQMKFVAINKEIIEKLVPFLETKATRLKTSDLIIALITRLNQATLITWDKQLLGNGICRTVSPKQDKTDS